MGELEHLLLDGRTALEVLADHLGDMRIAGEQRAVAMMHGDGRAGPSATVAKNFSKLAGSMPRPMAPMNSPFGP